MYTFIIDTPYTIELIFSNPLAIEITINQIYFITDVDFINETKDVENYNFALKIKNFQSVQIPSKVKDFALSLNVVSNRIGKFKIIGYIVNSFNSFSKILFSDLIKKEIEIKKNNNSIKSPIDAAYHVDVLPKLPIINYFAFKSCINNECFEFIAQDTVTVYCFTGEKYFFFFKLKILI